VSKAKAKKKRARPAAAEEDHEEDPDNEAVSKKPSKLASQRTIISDD